ncbi:hypothetical protein MMC13_003640 [Lambiella insularis]|nr:hypothetical protein [Lambiella insularis]
MEKKPVGTISTSQLSQLEMKLAETSISASSGPSMLFKTTIQSSSLLLLPYDVRLRIWNCVFPPGTIIHIANMSRFVEDDPEGDSQRLWLTKGTLNNHVGSVFRAVRCPKAHLIDGDSCDCDAQSLGNRFMDPAETAGVGMAVLRTCRQIYKECQKVAYSNFVLSFVEPKNETFTEPIVLFQRIGSRAASHIQQLSLACSAFRNIYHHGWYPGSHYEYDERTVLVATINWAARHGELKNLYFYFRVDAASVLNTQNWRTVSSVIQHNNRERRIDKITVIFEFRSDDLPHRNFLARVAGMIEGWSDTKLEDKYINRELKDQIEEVKERYRDTVSIVRYGIERLERFDTHMEERRIGASGAETRVVVKVDMHCILYP